LLYLPSYLVAGLLLLELHQPKTWWVAGARNTAVLLHGSWFLQTAIVLFPHQVVAGLEPWEEALHHRLPLYWAIHLLTILGLQVLLHWVLGGRCSEAQLADSEDRVAMLLDIN